MTNPKNPRICEAKEANESTQSALKATYRDEAFLTTLSAVATQRAECLARYHFARQFAQGKSVCDAACGVGYGSYYLAEVAHSVIGMDLNDEEIAWAHKHFTRNNTRFLSTDICSPWPLNERFDVITSFETIEHLEDPDRFLANIEEHLNPDGRLVLSVPNGPLDLKQHPDNYHHIQHFTPDALQTLIGRRFPAMECFTQKYQKNARHYLSKILRRGKTTRLLSNFSFVQGFVSNAKTWLIVASKTS